MNMSIDEIKDICVQIAIMAYIYHKKLNQIIA